MILKELKVMAIVVIVLSSMMLLLLVAGISSVIVDAYYQNKGFVEMPFSSGEVVGERCGTVELILHDAGFTNISVKKDDSGSEHRVTNIEVGEEGVFDSGEWFDPTVPISIFT